MLIAAAPGTWATVPTTNVVCHDKRNRNYTLKKYHCDRGFDWTPIHSIVVNGRCPGRQMTKGPLRGPSVIAPLPDNRFQNENKSYLSFQRSRVRVPPASPPLMFKMGPIRRRWRGRRTMSISVGEMNSSCKQIEKQRMITNRTEARPALAEPRGGFSLRRYHW